MTIITSMEWPVAMRKDIEESAEKIVITSLSMHVPRDNSITPYTKLVHALADARARGIPVRVWLAAPASHTPAASQNLKAREWLLAKGIEARLVGGPHLLHAKTMIVDHRIVWVGSGNWTPAAAHHNIEAYLRVESEKTAREWEQLLEGV